MFDVERAGWVEVVGIVLFMRERALSDSRWV